MRFVVLYAEVLCYRRLVSTSQDLAEQCDSTPNWTASTWEQTNRQHLHLP
jgi:hypothetical protein